ncbi:MAG: DsrE family protein [Alcanivoracaceae bacterium]|nr:DsrE family protein [Alcanivoracaceae bacterium]
MKYSIFINPKSENSLAVYHALNFVKAVLNKNHEIMSVFFYGYAVKDVFFNNSQWNIIANKNVTLNACSTIAESFIAQDLTPVPYIKLTGLGQWMESVLETDKNIEFV